MGKLNMESFGIVMLLGYVVIVMVEPIFDIAQLHQKITTHLNSGQKLPEKYISFNFIKAYVLCS